MYLTVTILAVHTPSIYTVEPLFNELLSITNIIFRPGKSYSKMYGTEPRFNEQRSSQVVNTVVDMVIDLLLY